MSVKSTSTMAPTNALPKSILVPKRHAKTTNVEKEETLADDFIRQVIRAEIDLPCITISIDNGHGGYIDMHILLSS
jgi:hypothetical protein